MEDATTIAIRKLTKNRLDKHLKLKETYDELLNRVLDSIEVETEF